MSALSLGALGMVPASASTAGTVQLAQRALSRVPAAAVRPAGVPAGSVLEKHNCAVIHVTPNGHEESVHCADVWFKAIPDEGGIGDVFGGNEVYCQTPGGTLMDCDSITEEAQMTSPQFPGKSYVQTGACGTVIGHSDCGVRRVENVTPSQTDDPNDLDGATCVYTGHAVDDVVETSDDTTAAGTIATGPFSIGC